MVETQKTISDEIDFDNKTGPAGMQELELGDITSQFVKNPKVGESITFEIAKVYRDKNTKAKTKEGRAFSTALSGVDYRYTLETPDGKKYSPPAWEIWGKIRALMLAQKKKNITVTIKHVRDGNKAKDGKENYEVTLV